MTDAPPRQRFRAELAETTLVNLGIAAANVATGILVARLLLPAGRGELAAVLSWPTVLGMLATLGVNEALVYHAARSPRLAGRSLGAGLLATVPAAVVFVAVGWMAMPVLLDAQADSTVEAARWYLLQVPVAAVFGLLIAPLRGIGDIRAWNLLRTLPTLAWLGVVLVAVAQDRAEPAWLALSFVVVRALLVLPVAVLVRVRLRSPVAVDPSRTGALVRYGLPNMLAVLPNTVNVRLDQLLLAALLPAGALGFYTVAVSWSLLASPLLLAFGALLFPRVAAERSRDEREALAGRGIRVGLLIAGMGGALTALTAPALLPVVFGPRFADAVPAAVVLSVAAALLGFNRVQQDALRGLGYPMAVLRSEVVGLLVTGAALAVAFGTDGGLGRIAAASVVGYASISVALLVELRRRTSLRTRDLLVPGGTDLVEVLRQVRAAVGR